MRIAFLILCHTDEDHIARLANRLTMNENFDVFIHVDIKEDINKYKSKLSGNKSVIFVEERYNVSWGGYSAIEATMALIKKAKMKYNYDRYVLLQGLDYPLKSNDEIYEFFLKNKDVEFIRGCNVSKSKDKYFYSRCKYILFYDKPNFLKKIWNKLSYILDLKLKKGYIEMDNVRYDIYWGSAQWALTGKCIDYILDFYQNKGKFNSYFKTSFPVDELYFTTIVFNSEFSKKTSRNGPENEKRGLVNWRNLHYFEYSNNKIKIFTIEDLPILLNQKDCLFFRKANSTISTELLDKLDALNNGSSLN